ncbi:MAG TPA: DNA repair exonuclease [Gemmataceae bacterium]|nr:DNA repair exonuclease [Gemmataceae bacterium]
MRILHTADWHLGDRLGRQDRTDDIRRAVERVADYCRSEKVDVLLVAGDLFSELAPPEGLRDAIRHLQETFGEFLAAGGAILALTGNHDKENFCQTLRHAMHLAAPVGGRPGELVPTGRLHLATGPTWLRLPDRGTGGGVQFVLMPYPTPTRYLTEEAAQAYQGFDEKNRNLMRAFTEWMRGVRTARGFSPKLPTVLAAHIAMQGSDLATRFRLTAEEDMLFEETSLLDEYAYVALGHIHKPQSLGGRPHIRYCGSIERLDLGEKNDDKGVVLFEVGPEGLRGEPVVLPIDATPMYDVEIVSPKSQISTLEQDYPEAKRALTRIRCTYTAGVDNREETLRRLEEIFPRWYDREVTESGALGRSLTLGEASRTKSFEDTVRDYLRQELCNHEDAVREAVLARAEMLLKEVQA